MIPSVIYDDTTFDICPLPHLNTSIPEVLEKTVTFRKELPDDSEPRYLKIVRPHEPIDILWENLDEDRFWIPKLKSWPLSILVISLSFAIIFPATEWQNDLN